MRENAESFPLPFLLLDRRLLCLVPRHGSNAPLRGRCLGARLDAAAAVAFSCCFSSLEFDHGLFAALLRLDLGPLRAGWGEGWDDGGGRACGGWGVGFTSCFDLLLVLLPLLLLFRREQTLQLGDSGASGNKAGSCRGPGAEGDGAGQAEHGNQHGEGEASPEEGKEQCGAGGEEEGREGEGEEEEDGDQGEGELRENEGLF